MEFLDLVDELEEVLEKGFDIPLVKKTIVDKERVIEILEDMRLQLPDELKAARDVVANSKKIKEDAQKQAEAKIKEVEHKIVSLIDEHEITKRANENADEIIQKAQKESREIKLASYKYVDEMLERVEMDIKVVDDRLKQCRNDLRK